MLARTKFRGRVFLKITLLNPRTTLADIESVLSRLKAFGHEEHRNHGCAQPPNANGPRPATR
jgi:L-2,4-diaminobutyrate decarboxylase